MFRPCFSATQVAGVIGSHKYQSVSQVMYEVFKKDTTAAGIISEIERAHSRKPTAKFKGSFLKDREIQRSVFSALDDCKVADAAVAKEVDATKILWAAEARSHELDMRVAAGIEVSPAEKAEIAETLVKATIAKKEAVEAVKSAPTVDAALDKVEEACKKVIDQTPGLSPAMAAQLLSDARGEVNKKRGLNNEDGILNTYESQRKVVVTERNTRMLRMDKGSFTLVGRTDGYVEAQKRVVDSKDRTTYWKTVPVYDEIQLRVYMHMLGAVDSELVERFPNGTTRHTVFPNDPEKWAELEAKLLDATGTMLAILGDASRLEDIVFENTVPNGN